MGDVIMKKKKKVLSSWWTGFSGALIISSQLVLINAGAQITGSQPKVMPQVITSVESFSSQESINGWDEARKNQEKSSRHAGAYTESFKFYTVPVRGVDPARLHAKVPLPGRTNVNPRNFIVADVSSNDGRIESLSLTGTNVARLSSDKKNLIIEVQSNSVVMSSLSLSESQDKWKPVGESQKTGNLVIPLNKNAGPSSQFFRVFSRE